MIMDVFKSIFHPDELLALVRYKLYGISTLKPKHEVTTLSADLQTCYKFLNQTSRSFAAVIQALDGDLRDAVCIFYLVLRALDTVEDDVHLADADKRPLLLAFHTFLQDPTWHFDGSSEKDRVVLEKFPVISGEFRKLAPVYQTVISDTCRQMGEGMTGYLDRAPDSLHDWDQYCHYVAGLVGIGLSRLFSASGAEAPIVGADTRLANSMGLFLQKTNIIRDYLEDVLQGRLFWPKEVWSEYCEDLVKLSHPDKLPEALACLNRLITDALRHVPDVVTYLSRIHNQFIFNFCAIPQVMAIATLERLYNNPAVFRGVVKIRKGEAVCMMSKATDLNTVKTIFSHFTLAIQQRIPRDSPLSARTRMAVTCALNAAQTSNACVPSHRSPLLCLSTGMLTAAILWNYWTVVTKWSDTWSA